MRTASSLALLSILLTGCLAPPPASVSTEFGTVRAEDANTALRAARLLEESVELLTRRVPDLREGATEVWVQDQPDAGLFSTPRHDFVDGFTVEVFWRRTPRVHVGSDNFGETLPHELVHALLGPGWETLPSALEEGLAEVLGFEMGQSERKRLVRLRDAVQVDDWGYQLSYSKPGGEHTARSVLFWGEAFPSLGHAPSRLSLEQVLSIRPRGVWSDFRYREVTHIYGAGYVIADRLVRRLGLRGLHALCMEAREAGHERIPSAWVLSAAGLSSEAEFTEVASAAFRKQLERELLRSGQLEERLRAILARSDAPPPSLEDFLRDYAPELSIDEGSPVPLEELPGFWSWASGAWPSIAHRD